MTFGAHQSILIYTLYRKQNVTLAFQIRKSRTQICSELDIISSSSSTEHIVGKWIDGKPIYAKTIRANINASGNRSIAHNVNGIGTFRAVDYSRSFLVRADGEYCPLPLSTAVDGQEYYASFVSFINETSVVVQVGTRTFGDYTITINYTKN